MKYKHRNVDNGLIDLGGRKKAKIANGIFEVPKDADPELIARLESAGHTRILSDKEKKEAAEKKAAADKAKKKVKPSEAKPPKEAPKEDAAEEEKPAEEKPEEGESETAPEYTPYDVLTSVDGVGDSYAKQLLEAYKDLDGVEAAGVDAIAEKVDGISPKRAEEILTAIKRFKDTGKLGE